MAPTALPALEIKSLTKRFGSKTAVADFHLTLPPGAFYGLLGANGAGKTTTMRMIAGLLQADQGSICVYGHRVETDPKAVKAITAWLPDEPLLYDKLTPMEYLEFIAGLWAVEASVAEKRAEELLRWMDLWDERDKRCETFSRGMKQKTALAGALLHDPKLLLLDEPFSGLDAAVARQVKELLVEKTKEGCTIVLTTHVMEIAERLTERVGIFHRGHLLADGSLEELRAKTGRPAANLEDIFIQLVDEASVSSPA
ncbi:ABC-type transporter ATP-binding protein EcsA [Candidatus Phycosocius bacilliformis]|uniref:ABC-type transporter ATP-binding protein EcsA n=1 Tax=Candidatus Phycosocius bacilliformis TaxID=1445552 RepID=A0A2P2E7Y1_9PROT|nr:ABC transporter ATP-binding protein [Candidatus Phycosocius bacilliformis]GBF57172.1 ABC-type transporter ATP-binding protein EcsA [Candidatus Phycosocius bacilliformis]